jgi:hypothetical protein
VNIYSRLLRLYRTNMVKTPLEDFTTEILAGLLAGNSEIGDAFVNQVLNITGSGFSFSTQEHFLLNEAGCPDCRVDMIIRSDEVLCFIENKVESREGYIQLERYGLILDSYHPGLKTYLKYCTKYYDHKNFEQHEFHQFRWADVYRFLKQWRTLAAVEEYLAFLNEHDMSDNMDFTLNDLLALQELNSVVKKMDRYLEIIKPIFNRYFDRNKLRDASNLRQIKEYSRYIFHADNIFGESGYSELGVGFDFSGVPSLKVWIWTDRKNDKSPAFKEMIQEVKLQSNQENWIGLSIPITDFVSSENMELEIEKWFVKTFELIKEFVTSSPQLNWHI